MEQAKNSEIYEERIENLRGSGLPEVMAVVGLKPGDVDKLMSVSGDNTTSIYQGSIRLVLNQIEKLRESGIVPIFKINDAIMALIEMNQRISLIQLERPDLVTLPEIGEVETAGLDKIKFIHLKNLVAIQAQIDNPRSSWEKPEEILALLKREFGNEKQYL